MPRRFFSSRICFTLAFLGTLGGADLSARAQMADTRAPADEVICGFAGAHRYLEAEQVRQGLAVDLLVGDARAGQPVTLRFYVNERPRNTPVDTLLVEHEKLLHVIVVSDDLREFFHLHPTRVGPGLWQVTQTFPRPGKYKVWSTLKYQGTSYTFSHALLAIVGGDPPGAGLSEVNAEAGFELVFNAPEPLIAGRVSQLQFTVKDPAGRIVPTENYLGAAMHLVLVKEDLSVFLHAHPGGHDSRQPGISFSQIFPEAGSYVLFAEYRPQKSKLPRGTARLAMFRVRVVNEPLSAGR